MGFLILGGASFCAWFMSLLTGGGSPFILIPLVSLVLNAQAVAPVITTGMLVGNGQRSLMFWGFIDWSVTGWYVPGAIAGALLGAYGLTRFQAEWMQLILGIVLVLIVLRTLLPDSESSAFQIKGVYFLPLAFFNAVGSALIGSTGPILNPAYLNYGLEKEALIATKAVHQMSLHTVKLAAYCALGLFRQEYWLYGLLIGVASIPANWLGKQVLARMSVEHFRQAVIAFVGCSGLLMIWEQRAWLPF